MTGVSAQVPVLSCQNLTHRYGPVEVLSDISLDFHSAEVHAIIGENGAGKSTLMKILAGHLRPFSGAMRFEGQSIAFQTPHEAEACGIVLVHQEILLAPHLTVAQNIFLGREIRRFISVNDAEMNMQSARVLAELGADIAPGEIVQNLSIAQRQLVQIARALLVPQRLVIFDEPTASLTPTETDALLKLIAKIKVSGVAILYISHRLPEVQRIADRVSVLRDGKLVESRAAEGLEPIDMARMMVGRDMAQLYPAKRAAPHTEAALEAVDFTVPGYAERANFKVRFGEIVGFAGLIGAGRTELFEGVSRLRPSHGAVRLKGSPLSPRSPKDVMDAGLVYLSEDRKGKGLLLTKTLAMNLTLASLEKFQRASVIDQSKEQAALAQAFSDFDIRAKSSNMLAGQLSGGNQQKLLLAKMMLLAPDVVVIDEPTRGVDIGAKQQIYRFIAELAAQGKAVVVISSEMPEIIGLCHRVYVMRSGRIVAEIDQTDMSEEMIVVHATGALKVGMTGAAA